MDLVLTPFVTTGGEEADIGQNRHERERIIDWGSLIVDSFPIDEC
jgi:hypothetical protein